MRKLTTIMTHDWMAYGNREAGPRGTLLSGSLQEDRGSKWPSRANHQGCRVLSTHGATRALFSTSDSRGVCGAFPIGGGISLHWVSAGTEGMEVLLYLATLAFLGAPWSLLQDDEDVCKLL
ncbi:hypothetical protein CCMA1212_008799 [Trichoderma ghanense]|uniref:Uncharacterized protein n=1 Tax=Trichoderma ghanense TaxID=65468 RepID=A0ABY2GVS9_9HYPO